ncbi:threonine--tRNA ligase [Patescibacteria group bacterium]
MTPDKLETMRHSCAHLLATAIQILYPKTRFGIGPAIEDGFYYDFEIPAGISEADLPKIENLMRKLAKKQLAFKHKQVSLKMAKKSITQLGQPYKLEILNDLDKKGEKKVSLYTLGDFIDLCQGPHVKNTGQIGPFKLLSVAGAYFKGKEANKMLTRIYGTCFENKGALEKHLIRYEQAKQRDHRRLGKEMNLFMFDPEVGPGLPLWKPKGALLRHLIMDFAFQTYLKRGYQPVYSPHIAREKLWTHSGHLKFYAEGMYAPFGIEGENYRLKPMNCPFHVQIYNSETRSYRDLPIRWTEMGTVYRYEKSGTLHGLTRVRGFTQDDAHIICTANQLEKEILEALELTLYILTSLGFDKDKIEMNLSVRDPKEKDKYIGTDQEWNLAEKTLKNALIAKGFKKIIPDVGGAVFYAPKIDVKVTDALDRKWQLSTIQIDFNLPSRFKMAYIGPDGKKHLPFMIHRALLGSLERFIGVFIEHCGGDFPLWLAPVQVVIIPITSKHENYGHQILAHLKKEGIRAILNDRQATTSNKIREGETNKIPFMLIVGDKELKQKKITVRIRGERKQQLVKIDQLIKQLQKLIEPPKSARESGT